MIPQPARRTAGPRRASYRPRVESLERRDLLTGTWTLLNNLVPSDTGTSTMMLLSDGTVMVQGGGTPQVVTKTWYQLTPDASGNYANGTWSQLPSMSLERYAYASNVLPDGRVFVLGGEYSGPDGTSNWTNMGEIYDPVANTWSAIQNYPRPMFGDNPSEVLPDGRVLVGDLLNATTWIYDPASDGWTQAGTKLRRDRSDEETWVKLPDDSILSYDIFGTSLGVYHSQRYLPAQDQWVDAGNLPAALSTSTVGDELGPAFLLPDGRAFYLGATNHTAYYDPATNSWDAGPDMPNNMTAADVPGAMMPNGKILVALGPMPFFSAPTSVFEFDPTTNAYTDVTPPPDTYDLHLRPNDDRMLVLPTGQVLFTNESDQLILYTPDGAPDPSWQPVIRKVKDNQDGTFTLKGLRLNGISEGACYGDDAEMSTNYPIVRLTDASGGVFYARTFNWSSTGVATGRLKETVEFTLPAGISAGDYALEVIGSGIASNPVPFTVTGPGAAAHGRGGSSQTVTGLLPAAAAPVLGSAWIQPDDQTVTPVMVVTSSPTDQGARAPVVSEGADVGFPVHAAANPQPEAAQDGLSTSALADGLG